jgi:hypothetical protein
MLGWALAGLGLSYAHDSLATESKTLLFSGKFFGYVQEFHL